MNEKGFSLIEILITLVVISIGTILVLPNLKRFNENNNLNTSASNLVSALHIAQTNAQTNVQCLANSPTYTITTWTVTLNSSNYQTVCSDTLNSTFTPIQKNYINGISMTAPASGCAIAFNQNNLSFNSTCAYSSGALITTLKDSNLSSSNCPGINCKNIKIEKGGSIYVAQ